MNQKSPQNQPQTIYDPQLVLAQFKRFLKTKKLSPLSIKNYLSDLRRFLAYLQNHQPHLKSLHSIKLHHFKSYLTHLTNQGFSPASLNRNIATLRQFGHFLEQVHNIENPTQNLARLGPTSPNSSSTNYIKHFTNYLKQQQLSSQTIKSYKSDINQYLHWLNTTYSSTQLKKLITKSNQQKYLNYLQKTQNHKPSTILRKSKSISRFTNWFTTIYSLSTPSDNKVTGTVPNRNTRGATSSRAPVQRGGTVPDVRDERRTVNQYFKLWRTYLLLAFIALFFTALGVFGYRQFKKDVILSQAYPSSPVTPNRQLSFQGRLVDSSGTPITTATNFQFKLYDAETNGTQLYDTGTCSITPDQDGVFSVQIGKDCGSAIPSSVFTENSDVWLEVTVGSETLSPRQQIATVAYALNAETIQGIPLAATMAAIRNTIVPMNQWGEVILGEQSPTLKGVAGTLQIQAPSLTFSTATGTNGNILFAPDGTGLVKVLSNTQDTNSFTVQNAQLTSGSLIKGYVGNDTATGNLLTLSSGSTETNQFTVDTSGNTYIAGKLGIGITNPTDKLQVYSSTTTPTLGIYNPNWGTGDENILEFRHGDGTGDNSGSGGQAEIRSYLPGGGDVDLRFYTTNYLSLNSTPVLTLTGDNNLGIGTTSPSQKLEVSGNMRLTGAFYDSSNSPGSNNYVLTSTGTGTAWTDTSTGAVSPWTYSAPYLYPDNATDRVGIGTTNTADMISQLYVTNGSTFGKALAIFNQTEDQDIITASASGATKFKVDNSGYVYAQRFVDLASSDYYLDPAASATSLTTAGSVGIGTTSPSYKLDVSGTGRFTSTLYITDGSAGAPSLSFTNDTNTGFYRKDHDVMAAVANGQEALMFSGQTGVGTFAVGNIIPANEKLLITGSGTTDFIRVSSANDETGDIFIVKRSGDVGIGTENPNEKLEVVGDLKVKSDSDVTTSNGSGSFYIVNSAETKGIGFDYDEIQSWGGNLYLQYNQQYGVDISNGTLFVDTSGNVGIGTTSPSAKLHVLSTGTNTVFFDSGTGTSDYSTLQLRKGGGNDRLTISKLNSDHSTFPDAAYFSNIVGGSTVGYIAIMNNGDVVTNSSIGIGTTSPGAKLDINGQIIGGFGAQTTSGTLDWNDASNARSGNGYTLLEGDASNGPGPHTYFHPFSFEYSSKNGSGNLTQFAIPYGATSHMNSGLYMRGRYSGTWSNWMRIISENNDGNVGIGTTSPEKRLHVYDSSDDNNAQIIVQNDSSSYSAVLWLKQTGNSSGSDWALASRSTGELGFYRNEDSTDLMRLTSDGNLGIGTTNPGTYKLYVNGTAYSTGGWQSSDIRWKKDIHQIQNALDIVEHLEPVRFSWRQDEYPDIQFPQGKQIGFIAQQVEPYLPEVVHTNNDGYKAVAYQNITALNTQAIKELSSNLLLNDIGDLAITYNPNTYQYDVATVSNNSIFHQISAFAKSFIGELTAGLVKTQKLITQTTQTNLITPTASNSAIIISRNTQNPTSTTYHLPTILYW